MTSWEPGWTQACPFPCPKNLRSCRSPRLTPLRPVCPRRPPPVNSAPLQGLLCQRLSVLIVCGETLTVFLIGPAEPCGARRESGKALSWSSGIVGSEIPVLLNRLDQGEILIQETYSVSPPGARWTDRAPFKGHQEPEPSRRAFILRRSQTYRPANRLARIAARRMLRRIRGRSILLRIRAFLI